MQEKSKIRVLKPQIKYENLFFYQKSDVVYQLSFNFCERYIHLYKDRTRDQVIQAARSCKQNIVEGLADGVTSTEMQLKLLNVARASLKELREVFEDYIKSRHLRFYGMPLEGNHLPDSMFDMNCSRYDEMLDFCRNNNKLEEYEPLFAKWDDEEMCNYGVTLCHMIDRMMIKFMEKLETEFVTEGGIKERMYKARTGYRQGQDERLKQLETENTELKEERRELKDECRQWQEKYEDLKQRALTAYNRQQKEIEELKSRLEQRG